MVDISLVNGIINQLITGGAPPCRKRKWLYFSRVAGMLWFTRRWTAGRRATFYNKEYPTSPSWGMTSRHPEEHSINPYCLRSWSSWPWLYWLLDHPYCFLKGLSCLFWNLGNWFGKRFENMSLTKSACSLCFWWPSVASSNSVEVLPSQWATCWLHSGKRSQSQWWSTSVQQLLCQRCQESWSSQFPQLWSRE